MERNKITSQDVIRTITYDELVEDVISRAESLLRDNPMLTTEDLVDRLCESGIYAPRDIRSALSLMGE